MTICSTVYGQLTVNLTQTAQQLIQDEFVSGNSNVTNVTVNGSNNPRSYGRFDRPAAGTPQEVFQRGIILSTGRAVDLPGPNTDDNAIGNVSASTSLGTLGDATLNLYSGQTTYDATSISFQFVPTSNIVRFRYIFASEEYTEYVNAGFNDVFAFLITGPGIVGEAGLPPNTRNIARLANNQPVAINTVNHLTNTSCFRNNVASFLGIIPGPFNIEYDGFTCILTAESPVIPCSTYTLQLMIADAGDRIYDSAVLLEANSFEFAGDTSSVASQLNLFNGQPITYESCDNDIRFTIRRSSTVANNATQNDTIFFEHVGTATYLEDYYIVPPYAVFAPGQTEVFIDLFPIYDGIDEPDETVILRFIAPGTCGQQRELQAIIRNVNYSLIVNPSNDTTICAPPGTVTLNLQAGIVSGPPGVTYRWTNLANGQTLSTNPTYSFLVTQNVSIEVRIAANVCNVPDVRDTIHVTILTPDPNNPLTVSMSDIPPVCGGQPITLSPAVAGGVGSTYTVRYYQNGVLIGNGVPFSFSPAASGNLLIEAEDECGNTASIFRPFVVEPGTMVASNNAVICSGQSTTLTAGVQNGALGAGYIYQWRVVGTNAFAGGGTSVTVSPTQTTTYYVTSPDFPCGNDTVTVTVIESTTIAPIPAQTVCPGQNATFTAAATGQGNITYTWTPPAGPPFVGNPFSPGVGATTTFTVTAQGDCGTAQTTAQLVVLPNDLSANLVVDPLGGTVCANTVVFLSVLASGGTPPYTYSWSGAAGAGPNVTVNPTGPTTISVNISDACTTVTRSVDLNAHPPLAVGNVEDVTICQGQPVTLSADVDGGSGNYIIQWRRVAGNVSVGNGNPVTFTPTQAGQYSLRVTDVDCGNQELRLFNINFIPPFTLDAISNQTICAGQTATFNAVTSATSGAVTYEWTQLPDGTPVGSNSPTLNISPTATTGYRLRVTDACTTRTVDFTVNVLPDNLDFTLSANPGVSVCTGNTVTFSANVTGGTGNLGYLWTYGSETGSGTTFTVTITGAGTVSLRISDDCRTVTRTMDISVEPPVSLVPPPPATICFGSSTTLTAIGSGGQPPMNYAWTGPNGFTGAGESITVSPQADATYTVTLTDACGTSLTQTVTVTVRPDLSLNPIAGQTICQGETANLSAVYSGGTAPVVVEWFVLPNGTPFSGDPAVSLSPATTTNYRLVVRDVCFTRQTDFTITVIPATLATMPLTVLPANTVCVGATVTLSTTTSGGSGNYTWTWNPPAPSASSASFVVTQAGAYSVTVSDGCQSITRTVNINVAPALNLSASDDQTICIGENATLTANGSGGLSPLNYAWTGPNGFSQSGASVTVTPTVTPSVYTVTLTDVCGTSLSETVTVNLYPDLTLTPQTNRTICQGETVNLTAEYLGGNPPVSVEWFELPNATIPIFTSGSVSLSPSATASYRLVVRDNCIVRQSDFTITVTPGNLALSPIVVQPATTVCSGTTITLSANASGGSGLYNYTWTPSGPNSGTAQFVVTASGTYSVVVDDGCNTRTRTVNINLAPDLNLTASGTATICPGQTTQLTASATGAFAGGTLPIWTDANNVVVGSGNVSVSPNATAVYTASISDSCGNIRTETVTVTVRPELLLSELEDRTICEGESTTYNAVASGAGTLNYIWTANGYNGPNAPGVTLSPGVTTTYTLTVSDDCASRSETFTVNVHPATLAIANFTAPTAVCAGTTVNFAPTVSGGSGNYTYTWTPAAPNAPTASFTINGFSAVSLTVADGCQTVTESVFIDINTPITISAASDTAICPVTGVATLHADVQNAFGTQGTISWFASGGAFVGSGPTINVSPSATSVYYATVSDDCGSAQSNNVTVVVLPAATLQSIEDVTICQGETVNLSAVASGTGTLQYRWSEVGSGTPVGFDPDVTLTPAVTTDYQIQITDDCNTLFDPFRITVIPANLTVQPLVAPAVVCEGTVQTLTANASGGSGNYTYTWNPAAPNSPSADFVINAPITVSVTVFDGCNSVTQTLSIGTNAYTQISAYGDVNICAGSSTTIGANVSGGLGNITGPIWTDATGAQVGTGNTISVSPQNSTFFVATATDECNVSARDTVWIVVFDSVGVGNLDDRILCLGESTEYTAVVAGNGQVAWYLGNDLLGNDLSITLSPLATTNYRLEVSDSCFTLTRHFTVSIHPTDLAIASLSPPVTVCQNSTTPLTVVASGGTGNYTYLWSTGGTTATENAPISGPGYFSVVVSDGCTSVSDSVFININTPTQISAYGDVNLCVGSSTTIGANVSGGLGNITGPIWTDATGAQVGTGNTISVSPQNSTFFVATATDECNVSARDTVWIVVFDSVGVGNLPNSTICHGESADYTAAVSGAGTVRWINTTTGVQDGSGLTVTLSPTQTTTYRLEVEDSCFVLTRFFTITVHPPDLALTLTGGGTVCQGSTHAIVALPTGGTGTYAYAWTTSPNTGASEEYTVNQAGYVYATVSDGCRSVTDSVYFDLNTPTQISAYGDVNLCVGSSTTIGANVSGGLGNITGPIWTDATGAQVGTGNTISVSPQNSTFFVATATDECNVSARDTVWIVVFDSVGVGNLPNSTICHGESADYTAAVSGAGTVRWINTTTGVQDGSGLTVTLSPTQTTTYRLEVEDSCFVLTRFFTITVHPPDLEISQNLPSAGPLVCSGTVVTLSVFAIGGTGTYEFTWSDGQTGAEIQHVVPGDETVWVWVYDGCRWDSTAFTFVTDPAVLATAAGSINICEGSSTEISVVYSGGAPPLNAPVWTLADGTPVGEGDVLIVSPVQTTRYFVSVSDVCGTTAIDSVNVTVFGPFGVGDLDDRTICFGEETTYTAQIAGTGEVLWERESGSSYDFVSDQASVTLSPSVTTNFRLTVSDSCFVVTREFTVAVVPPTLSLNLTASVPSPVCSGTEVAFNAEATGGSGNYLFTWSDGSETTQTGVVVFGPVSVYVTLSDGCQTVSDTLHYDVTSPMALTTSGDATICLYSSTTLQAFVTGGVGTLEYLWTTGNIEVGTGATLSVTPEETTTYLVTVTDECNAMVAEEVTVTVLSPFGLGTLEDRTVCFGESTTYSAPVTGAADLRWIRASDNSLQGTSASITLSPPVTTDYLLIVNDECFIDTVAFTVNVIPATLTIDSLVMNPPPPVCVGTPITLMVYVSGGSGIYEYNWSQDDSGTDVLHTTVTGSGSVVVRVGDGCQSVTAEQAFSDNPDLSIDAGPDLTVCPGQTANLFVTFTGGFGDPDNFLWIDLSDNSTVSQGPVAPVSPSSSRSYRVILADDCGTSASDTVMVSLFEPLFVAPPMDTVICEGQCVEYTAQVDGTGTTTFEWLNFTTGSNMGSEGSVALCPLTSTMYILTVRDTCGEVEYIFNVYVTPSDLSVEIAAAPAAFVCINETVTLTATAAGGSGTYHYLWEDGLTAATREYVVTGPGTVEVQVFDGCTYSTNTIEFGVAPNVVANAGPDLGICPGGTVILHGSATSGFGIYAYEWYVEGEPGPFGFAADVPVTPTSDTRYVVRAVDECGTEDYDTVWVRILEALVIEPLPYETTICQGDSVTYSIVSSGVGEVQYLWYAWGQDAPIATGQTVTLSPDQSTHYAVVVSDSCATDSLDFVINVIRADLAWHVHIGPATDVCPGTEVTISATATGGSGSYTWTGINGGAIVATVGTVAQSFVISVFDGCLTLDSTIVLTPFGPPVAYAGLDGYVCAGDELTLNGVGAGGSGAYSQVRWTNLAGDVLFAGNPYTFVPTFSAGYVFAFEDSCGMAARDTVFIEVRPIPVVDAGTGQEVCRGTPVQLNGSVLVGQFCEFIWTPASGLNNPNALNPVATPNVTTLYSLLAICNGCTSLVDTVRVKINPNPIVGTDADTVFYCLDGLGVELPGYVFSGTPPISVEWQPAAGLNDPALIRPFASPETETTYTLSAIDTKGCVSNTVTVTVKHIPLPLADAGEDREVCVGDPPFNLMGSGVGGGAMAYTYRWEPSTGLSNANVRNPLVFPDSTRTYTLYVTSQPYGCRSQNVDELSTVTVRVKRPPVADAGPDRFTCEGGTVQLSGSGSGGNGVFEYRWTPAIGLSDSSVANPTATPPHTFTYMLQVVSDGCVSSVDAVTVYVGGSPTVALPNVFEICPGETVDLNALVTGAQQPYTYTWEPPLYLSNPTGGSTVATPTENITYTLYVAANGCPGIQADSVQIVIRPGVFADADTTDRGLVICRGDSARLPASASGPSPLHWAWLPASGLEDLNNINPIVSPETTTVYTLEVWRGPCRAVDSVRVTVVDQTSVSIIASADGLCDGHSVMLTAHAEVTGVEPNVVWRRGAVEIGTGTSIVVYLPGVYSVSADWNGACFATDTIRVKFVPNPSADFVHSFPGGCDALDVSFQDKSANATAWIWNFGDGSPLSNEQHPRHYFSAPGKYRVSLTTYSTHGCSATKTADVDVSVEALIQPEILSDPPPGTTLYLTDATVNFFDSTRHVMARNWYFGDGYHSPYAQPSHRFLLPGTYTVKVTLLDSAGCTYERQLGPYTVLEPELDIPNIFTPNGDGRNDFFRPNYEGVEKFTYSVFDRWGNTMYKGDELSTGWNGADRNGRPAAEGAYLYVLKFDERRVYKGAVTLIR